MRDNTHLSARHLTFAYDRTEIISDWDIDFAPGALTAITGPSGRGKSTLLYLLGLMLTPDRGDLMVRGCSAAGLSDAERSNLRAREFGFVFQDAALDSTRSVLDNVTEAALYRGSDRGEARREALVLLDRFGVGVRANAKPGQVSGGQAQRIALCRAMLGSPSIILADEPTGNLDRSSAMVVMEAFAEYARSGATVVLVTHDVQVAESCDERVDLA